MRDIFILAVVLGSAPICLFRPYLGILMWTLISYLSPHRFTWGVAYHFPVAEVIAVPTLVGLVFTRKMNRQVMMRETLLALLLWIWFGVTLLYASHQPLFAAHIAEGTTQLVRVSKILLMTVATVLLVTSKKELKYLYLVTSFSFGLLAIKGALFGMRTGGESRVWGPPDTFIADNNDMALALNMSLPIFFFLAQEEENRLLRILLRIMFVCGIFCVILTYSRGGLLGLGVVLTMLAIKSHRKLIAGSLLTICVLLVLSFAPAKWMTRMQALVSGQLDSSAMVRIGVWKFGLSIARAYPITGGGLGTYEDPELFERLSPEPLPGGHLYTGPHSIYFQVLGEQGYVGLALFLLLLASCIFSLRGLRRRARGLPAYSWMINYSHMLEVSLVAYMVSGAFLGRAYFDFFYLIIACVAVSKIIYKRDVALAAWEREASPAVTPEEELVRP